jgi:hypothetical protein
MNQDGDRHELLDQLEHLKSLGEKAYSDMYESSGPGGASGCYSEAKECYYDAIRVANLLGLTEQAEALSQRLDHIKAVFRGQFC